MENLINNKNYYVDSGLVKIELFSEKNKYIKHF